MSFAKLRFLLLQVRNSKDPMRHQEIECFARGLGCNTNQIATFDLLSGRPDRSEIDGVDVVLLGGSGHYSAASEGAWLERSLDCLRELNDWSKPTFASCWGFQAMGRALGGTVVHDPNRAELGTKKVRLTPAGVADPIFGDLGDEFSAQMGHEDCVSDLPTDAVLLASSDTVVNQAFRVCDKPIYCTQFHPELNCQSFLERIRFYSEYIERISGLTFQQFADTCYNTPETELILQRFITTFFHD